MAKAKGTSGTSSKRTATRTTSKAKAGNGGAAAAAAPAFDLQEVIRVRAYQLYEEGGQVYGKALDDWLRAEAEVLSLHGTK